MGSNLSDKLPPKTNKCLVTKEGFHLPAIHSHKLHLAETNIIFFS